MTILLEDVHEAHEHLVGGNIKFRSEVPLETLIEIARKWRGNAPSMWKDLHIRSAGDDGSRYIAFTRILPDGTQKTHKRVVHKLMRTLMKKLGVRSGKKNVPSGVERWSIATIEYVA